MEIKKYLFEELKSELSVEEVFPRYTRKLVDSKLIFYTDQRALVEDEIKYLQSEQNNIDQEFENLKHKTEVENQ